jgi:hypothetical protein
VIGYSFPEPVEDTWEEVALDSESKWNSTIDGYIPQL